MKKKYLMITMAMALVLAGCSAQKDTGDTSRKKADVTQSEHASTDAEQENSDTQKNDADSENEEIELTDPFTDYTDQIQTSVDKFVSKSDSLQEELEKMENLAEQYEALTEHDLAQSEIAQLSQWTYKVWDTELNSLWSRMSDELDADVKESILEQQRNWISLKEKVVEESISDYKEGSMYPMLYNEQMADVTRTRVYQLADAFAKEKGEDFTLPKRDICGTYIDSEGTDSVYSSLSIRQGMENDLEAVISIYREGEAEGTIEKDGDTLVFRCEDYGMEANITYGWDGAVMEVTKADDGPFEKGGVYEFPMVF